jgi:hypothetical protein
VGGRPRVPASLARAAEGGGRVITSDDLFSLKVSGHRRPPIDHRLTPDDLRLTTD